MREGAPTALVCGFSDLAAGLGGLAWELGRRGGLLLRDNSVRKAEVDYSQDAGELRLSMSSEDAEVEMTLAPTTVTVSPQTPGGPEPPGGPLEAAICTATVRSKGWGRTFQCPGHMSRWSADPLADARRFRHLAVGGAEGSLLLLCARGESGAAEHGEEEVAAWLLDREGGSNAFEEALLSTQYRNGEGPTRVGLELWPRGEDQSVRAAAIRAAGTRLGGSEDENLSAVLLRSSTEGTEGLGSYLIVRQ
jgi:hypothetical protein